MADRLSKLRDLLIFEAERRKGHFLIGPENRPNGAAIARAMGVNRSTIDRILALKPSRRADVKRRKNSDWVSEEITQGLSSWLNLRPGDVINAIDNAPAAKLPESDR